MIPLPTPFDNQFSTYMLMPYTVGGIQLKPLTLTMIVRHFE